MSANLVQSLGSGVRFSPCSPSGRCNIASAGQDASRKFRSRTSVSTRFSNSIFSSVDALKFVATSRTGCRNGCVGVTKSALFPFLDGKKKEIEKVKIELLDAIAPLERGVNATADDLARVDLIAKELEKRNPTKEPLKSPLLNGKWKLIYTTSESILKKSRAGFLRPNGPIYQAINTDTLRAQNLETWPYFNQVTANLLPIDSMKVIVNFDFFKIAGLPIFSYHRNMGVAGRFLHHISMTINSIELRVHGHNSVDNKASYTHESELPDSKNPVDLPVERQSIYSDQPDRTWCGLCGTREGWMSCGSCMGEGGYVTKPGLAGVKGKVGWASCKTCFGHKILPCLLCGSESVGDQKRLSGEHRSTQEQKFT